jgi:Transposase
VRQPFDPVGEIPQPIVTGPNRILTSNEENRDDDRQKVVAEPEGEKGMGSEIAIRRSGPGSSSSACGGDYVGNSAHYVAVRPDRDPEPVRRFECFTADLHHLADWLKSCGVKTVVMQSTGVYWIPLYEVLEDRGFEVYLVNARHTKNLPGRKSDVQESQ